jgi:hypothetical protein
MRYFLVPYSAGHLTRFSWHADDRAHLEMLGGLGALQQLKSAGDGPAATLMGDDDVLACWGLVMHWPGLAEAWCLASQDIGRHALAFHRKGVWWLHHTMAAEHLRRVQCAVAQERQAARRWVRRLGLKREAVMPQYGPRGETFELWAIMRFTS